MIETIRNYLIREQLVTPGEKVCVALSGGADSVALLLVLKALAKDLGVSLSAVHVNHGLRGKASDEDEAFVRHLCETEHIPLSVSRVDVRERMRQTGEGLEEAARNLRYLALGKESRSRGAVLAVAHHRDDCDETFFLHLVRGSGLAGLSGMKPRRILSVLGEEMTIIRPLLPVDHQTIKSWLQAKGQAWCEDESNQVPDTGRNILRLSVLPLLKEISPGLSSILKREEAWFSDIEAFLTREAERVFFAGEETEGIACDRLRLAEPVLACYGLRCLCQKAGLGKNLSERHIKSLLDLAGAGVGSLVCLPGGFIARRTYDRLVIENRGKAPNGTLPPMPLLSLSLLSGCGKDYLADAKASKGQKFCYLDGDSLSVEELTLRTRRTGDYICVTQSGGRKSLKDYFIDSKVEQALRDTWPVLCREDEVVWVTGKRISEAYRITEKTKRVIRAGIGEDDCS